MSVTNSALNLAVNPAAAITGINMLGGSMGNIYKIALQIGAAFAGWKITQAVFSSMKSAEQQIIRLKTALQSATKGVETYREAVKFASATPFSVQSVIDASVALRVFQFDPFKETTKGGRKLIGVLGDMAGAMGVDVTEASHALTRAMVGEWEVMQNTFQISARTIPKLAGLRSGTKAYGDAIVEFLTKQKRFNGGMDETARSLSGMISNITDAIDIMFMGIAGVADSAEGVMKGLTLYDSVRDAFKGIYDAVSASNDVLDESGKIIKDGISQGEKLMRMGQGIGQVFKVVFDTVIKPFFDFFAWGISAALDASERFFAGFYDSSKHSLGLARKEVQIFNELTTLYMAKTPQALAQGIGKASAQTQAFLKKMGITAKSTNAETQKAIQKSFLESKNSVEKGFLIFVIFMAIVGEVIKSKMDKIREYFRPLIEKLPMLGAAIGKFFMSILNGILTFGQAVWSNFSKFLPDIQNDVSSLIEILAKLFTYGGDSLDSFTGFFKVLGHVAGFALGVIVKAFLTSIKVGLLFRDIVVQTIATVSHLWNALKNLSLDELILAGKSFYGIWEGIWKIIDAIGSLIKSSILGAVELLADIFGGNFDRNKKASSAGTNSTSSSQSSEEKQKRMQGKLDASKTQLDGMAANGQKDSPSYKVLEAQYELDKKNAIEASKEEDKRNKNVTDLLKQNLDINKTINGAKADEIKKYRSEGRAVPNKLLGLDIGEWNVPRDQVVNIHRGEMVIPAQDSERIRSLFGSDASGNMKGKGSLLADSLAQFSAGKSFMNGLGGGSGGSTSNSKTVIIHQNFYGKAGVGTAATSMKSSARDLVAKMDLM